MWIEVDVRIQTMTSRTKIILTSLLCLGSKWPQTEQLPAPEQNSVADGVSVVMNKQDEGLFWKSTIIREHWESEQSTVKFPSRAEEEEH